MKLLLVSASAGAGHTRAAQALEETARLSFPDVTMRHVDILDFVDRVYRKTYAGGYLAMVDRAPELWGYFYEASDRVPREGFRRNLVRAFDRMEFARFRAVVRDFAPDVVLATHFLAAQVFPPKERRKIPFRFGLVVTDFDVHAFWVQPHADVTFVATEELRAILAGRGIAGERIAVTGIPIMPAFAARHDRRRLRAAYGIAEGVPAVLVMGGGSGVGSMRGAVEAALGAGRAHVLAPVQAGIPALERGASRADEGGRPSGGEAARRPGDPFPHASPLSVVAGLPRGRSGVNPAGRQ
ncbi:MAG TPA: hypothetical protein VLJ18_00995 [Thermoanaerobaculia bacterium]|nr:hypothetical protein [Thermoanaerobaculia bacterium]